MKKVLILIFCIALIVLLISCAENNISESDTTTVERQSSDMTEIDGTTDTEAEATSIEEGTTVEVTAEEEPTTAEDVPVERTVDKRYFIYRIWNFQKNTQDNFERTVNAAADAGFNAIKVHIPWTWIEQTDGNYVYDDFDKMVDYVVNVKKMSVAISLDMTRLQNDEVIPESEIMVSRKGQLCVGGVGGNRTQISFANQHAVDKAVEFYKKSVIHFEEKFGNTGLILLYLPAFSQYCETEYWCADEYDYSPAAISGFYKYLSEKYGTVAEMNTSLKTDYASFDEVEPPVARSTKLLGADWYRYRHSLLKNVIDKLADAQKSACPNTKFAVQFGCVYDDIARLRGTLGFVDLCEKADIIWCDDGPTMDHHFSMSYVWSALPAHIELAQEIDGPAQVGASPENYLRQGLECYALGCKYVSIANWSIDAVFESYKPVWREISDKWLTRTTPELMNYYGVMYPEKEPIILDFSLNRVFKSGFAQQKRGFDKSVKAGVPVLIKLNDDFFE